MVLHREFISVGLLLALSLYNVSSLSCLDGVGNSVDYWAINKYPQSSKYLYWDNLLNTSLFRDVGAGVDEESSPLIATLEPLYASSSDNIAYAMYNDEAPDGTVHSSKAHSKGVLVYDSKKRSGYWITHSLPRFPNDVAKGMGDLPDLTYAQHFFCISVDKSGYDKISSQMQINDPFIYDSNLPDSIDESAAFYRWVSQVKTRSADSDVVEVRTSEGTRMTLFAKSKRFLQDLWDGLVVINLQVDLAVQSWKNGGGGNLPSSCAANGFQNQVMNIEEIDAPSLTWKATRDHSKWGVAIGKKTTPIVCFGDINRQSSQIKRGGGAICLENVKLWNAMTAITGSYESC